MDLSSIFFKKVWCLRRNKKPQASERERSRGRKEKVPCYLYAGTLLHSSVEDKTPGRCVRKGWLVYPAYPRHFFSLRGLVHICIPHTGTPCGRVIGNRSYWLSWVFPLWDCLSLTSWVKYNTLNSVCQEVLQNFLWFFRKNLEKNCEIYIREIKSKEKYKEEKEIRINIIMFTICLQKN